MAVVYSYIRFSSKKQEQGDSLRRQRASGEKWIDENGHVAGKLTLEDTGVSAFRGKNRHEGALKRFLDEVESGNVERGSILLVENLDRLSREGIYPALGLFGQILEAGIEIVVLDPYEQRYTSESTKDLVGLLIPLIHFYLAYLESLKKSNRLKKAWNEKRRLVVDGKKFNKRCPSWLQWSDSTDGFERKDGWEAIPFIFEKSADGYGHKKILGLLHERFAALGNSKQWNESFVASVLSDRSVLGELQPKEIDADGSRVPAGPPVIDYYPQVVSEELWYQAQAAKQSRLKQKGPNSKFTNLFTGLVFCAQDHSAMHVQSSPDSKGGRVRRLISYKHKSKQNGACSISLEYNRFEQAVLGFLAELSTADLQPRQESGELRTKERELAGLTNHLSKLEETLTDPSFSNVKTLVSSIRAIEGKVGALQSELEALKRNAYSHNTAEEVGSVLDMLYGATNAKEYERLRLKLRLIIPDLVESIWVKPEKHRARSVAVIQVVLTNGGTKFIYLLAEEAVGVNSYTFVSQDGNQTTTHIPANIRSEYQDLWHPVGLEMWSAKKMLEVEDAAITPVPEGSPKTVLEASKKWLALKENEVGENSFRTIPAAIGRVVKALGGQTQVSDINKQKWGRWKRYLKKLIKDGELQQKTGRVNYNRSKEFLRWLFDEGLTEEWDGWRDSAAKVLS